MHAFTKKIPSWTVRETQVLIPPRRSDIVVDKLESEAVFCDPENGNTYHFNETSLVVWECCDGETTLQDTAHRLADHFDVDFDTALDDVEELIELFVAFNLIVTANRS